MAPGPAAATGGPVTLRRFAPLSALLALACAAGPPPTDWRIEEVVTLRAAGLARGALTMRGEALDDDFVLGLLADPRVQHLTDLGLAENRLGPASVQALLTSSKSEGLRALDLSDNPIGDEGLRALATSPRLATVDTLLLASVGASSAGVTALLAAPLPALRQLDLSGNAVADAGASALVPVVIATRLTVEEAGIGASGARALIGEAHTPRLALAGNPVGTGGLAGLAAISPELRELSLVRTRIGAGDAAALAALPAPDLAVLDLHGNPLGDEGVRALASAPWFATLTTLDLRETGASGASYTAVRTAWGDRPGLQVDATPRPR